MEMLYKQRSDIHTVEHQYTPCI